MQKIFIATGNKNKYEELEEALSSYFECQQYNIDLVEIQGTSQEIIQHKLNQPHRNDNKSVSVNQQECQHY